MNPAGDLRERNIGAIFDALDTDADGLITAADVSRMAALACDQLGLAGTAKGTQLTGIWASWWEQLAAEADAGGRISRAAFVAAHISGRGDPAAFFQQQIGRFVAAEAKALDTDGDGYIEPAEYAAFLAAGGVAAEIALAGFDRLDTDHDGKISIDELVAGAAQFFLSPDPADHGTAMLGHS